MHFVQLEEVILSFLCFVRSFVYLVEVKLYISTSVSFTGQYIINCLVSVEL